MAARGRIELLQHLVGDAQRAMEEQRSALRRNDALAAYTSSLWIGLIAAALATGAFALRGGPPAPGILWALAVVVAQAVVGLGVVAWPYAGFGPAPERFTSPNPAWLVQRAELSTWTLRNHLEALLVGYARFSAENERVLARHGRARILGLRLLAGGTLGYLVGLLFILGGGHSWTG